MQAHSYLGGQPVIEAHETTKRPTTCTTLVPVGLQAILKPLHFGQLATGESRTLNEDYLLRTRQYYSEISLWPSQPSDIDPKGWLDNFRPVRDREIARELLGSFIFINAKQTESLFISAFHAISSEIIPMSERADAQTKAWQDFRKSAAFSFPTAGTFDPAASGSIFLRMARQKLRIDESQLFTPDTLVSHVEGSQMTNIVIVDDFAGSGEQFISTILRDYENSLGAKRSLKSLLDSGRINKLYYIPLVCTTTAKITIQNDLKLVKLRPAHILPPSYQIRPKWGETSLVPPNMVGEIDDFLARYAAHAGYPVEQRFGYNDLGLALAFEHSIPDNTLPIFWSENENWKPLRRRL